MSIVVDDSWMLPCFTKQMIGMDCPGCGIQRSISLLLQGKVIDSFFMYPALLPAIFLLGFLIFDMFVNVKYGEKIKLWGTIIVIGTILTSYIIKLSFI
ncbi:hypothetical protein AAU57_13525 [Nonlabens sp. YIK11]|uniref:DUF2752 domain-containing protein n=1 Tax=Nonlabens sp. YIK11 TaxID=1453349 RepID=UPI0006DC30D8|nr:DUF2752 domain-containing protein [Nonlabens sp. YIK11]KQC34241.1 hypothetical protein AAU57_13525 [Nonlabens sp. YIK11]